MRRALIPLSPSSSSSSSHPHPSFLPAKPSSSRSLCAGASASGVGARGARGRGAHARVLVSVGGDVGDEFLGCEREEAGEGEGCGGGGETGDEEVVLGYGVGDLLRLLVGSLQGKRLCAGVEIC